MTIETSVCFQLIATPTQVPQFLEERGNEQIKIPRPESVMLYTTFMGGVDRVDQFRSYYDFGRTTKKWWKYLFAFVVNTAITEEKERVPTAAIRKDEHLRGDALKLHGNAEAVICLYVKWDVFLLFMKKWSGYRLLIIL
ncbi:hypothetical protein J437_LFUL003322 [Ladona fulva]|uniref:PiggyBac transposable element-derived protein domain-containing protein n=1 Tax=Ladona fulva TaxID=123851 RepID=A0A8K0KNL1_LADFU|nr:hypothetical protein J437_LFUL003322 [Ladona fulva]